MKITLEPTGKFESVNGHRCRIWKGSYNGHPVIAHVAMVGLATEAGEQAHAEFGKELQEVKVERELVSFDMRMVM